MENRTLYFGDNLRVIEERIPDNFFDLIRTSSVLKDRDLGSLTNVDNIWVQTLEHLYIFLYRSKV